VPTSYGRGQTPLRFNAMTQAWVTAVPPQSTVIVAVAASQTPVQPVRATIPSVRAAPVKSPVLWIAAVPLIPDLPFDNIGDTNVMPQAV
jgi:hypothetical protein